MLHRGAPHALAPHRHASGAAPGPAARIVLAVASSPRLGSPARWGWPHWLAPVYQVGGQHRAQRPLEDYL